MFHFNLKKQGSNKGPEEPETGFFKSIKNYQSPPLFVLLIALSIFAAELVVMAVLSFLPEMTVAFAALVDASILIVLVSPIIYFLVFRPMLRYIIERAELEARLRKERDRAQQYLDIAGVIIVVIGRDMKVKLINHKGAGILGYEEDEIIGKDWFEDFVPPDRSQELRSVYNRLMEGAMGTSNYYESLVQTKKGERRIIRWYNALLKEDSRVTGILSSGEDITERRKAREALIESETKYRLIYNTMFDGIITTDRNDRIIDCNPSAAMMFGYTKEELVGKRVEFILPENCREDHRKGMQEFLRTGISALQGRVKEFEGLKKNKEVFPLELIVNSFTLGGELFFTSTVRDITEKKRTEEERERIQAQLSQSQKMEAVGRLAGGVAHDFNNILAGIRGNAELIIEALDKSNPLYARTDEILLSVMHASKLIRQLLLFSRGQPIEMVPLNVNRTVENLLLMIGRIIGENITIASELAPDLWKVKADEGNMEQVLLNLAINARDAMPGGGRLLIRTENAIIREEDLKRMPEARPGEAVRLIVQDTGVGIDKDLLPRIFEPFFTTKELGKGTGFGLAVVYGIVRQHKGWIVVESAPGKGSAFSVYLPAYTVKEEYEEKGQAFA